MTIQTPLKIMLKSKGFTLVELLVALFVFALLTAFSYRAVSTLVQSQQLASEQVEAMSYLSKAILLWEQDARQLIPEAGLRDAMRQQTPGSSVGAVLSVYCCVYGWQQYYPSLFGLDKPQGQRSYVLYHFKDATLYRSLLVNPVGVVSAVPDPDIDRMRSVVLLDGLTQASIGSVLVSPLFGQIDSFESFPAERLLLSHSLLGGIERVVGGKIMASTTLAQHQVQPNGSSVSDEGEASQADGGGRQVLSPRN